VLVATGRSSAAQADRTALLTEIEATWRVGDFTRLGQLCQNYLGGVLDQDGAAAAFPLAGLAASEIIAGRNADAFGHLRKAFTNLIQDSCRKRIGFFQPAYLTAMMLLGTVPENRSPLFQAVMKDLLDSLESSPPASKDHSEMTRGMIIAIASNLTSRCLADGDMAGARAYADKAMALSPPVEPDRQTLRGDLSCGCILFSYSTMAGNFSGSVKDELVRTSRIQCFHPQRAMALFAAISVDSLSGDSDRLRQTAFAAEDLLDRGAPTGSFRDNGVLREMLEKALDSVRQSFPGYWPAPAAPESLSLAEVEGDPVLGEGRAVVLTRKWKKDSDYGLTGTSYFIEIKARLPVSEVDRSPEGIWWVYRLEKGQLRGGGKVHGYKSSAPKRAGAMSDFHSISRLTEGLNLSGAWNSERDTDAKAKATALAEALTPCFISRELIGLDFEGLPPHRLALFMEGIPWVGMSTRLLRLNLREALTEGSENFYKLPELESLSSAEEEFTINSVFCDIKIRDRKVTGIQARKP